MPIASCVSKSWRVENLVRQALEPQARGAEDSVTASAADRASRAIGNSTLFVAPSQHRKMLMRLVCTTETALR